MTDDLQASSKLRVVIVDDHALFRDGLATILGAQPGIEVAGQGGSAQEAVTLARELNRTLSCWISTCRGAAWKPPARLQSSVPETKMIILTASEAGRPFDCRTEDRRARLLLKGVAARELIRILRSVAGGELCPACAGRQPAAGNERANGSLPQTG